MQDGTPLHIARCVKQVLRCHFGDDKIISPHFPTALSPRFPELNPCEYWLWGYLNAMVYHDPIMSLSDFQESIERHVCNIPHFMLL
ncbi:uncharacterized protein TNCV_3906131 [Trichonephila clavipes]|nr:uncharacterized protein TNCV_3906131 [Trichonephila clavipes]